MTDRDVLNGAIHDALTPHHPSVIAIDPGTIQSAWLVLGQDGLPKTFAIDGNDTLIERLRNVSLGPFANRELVAVIEKVESYGMAVGREVFDTVHWAGRFTEALHPITVVQLPRREVKLTLCGSSKANDANIRAALIDHYGGSSAIGTKKAPGPLYGISKDVWSALGLGVAFTARTARKEQT